MNATYDELAGVVDLFGGLTREELADALEEVAFRADGRTVDEDAVEDAIAAAMEAYTVVPVERDDGDPLLVAGPAAFPETPAHGEDLPHILDVGRRTIDREAAGEQLRERFIADAVSALDDQDRERIERLIDVSYDVEAWAPVDLQGERERLADGLDRLE